jgi:hypothetical protein
MDLELARSNERSGISIAVLNARNELLAQQILSILPRFQQETTRPEMRTLAHALAHADYWDRRNWLGNGLNLLLAERVQYSRFLPSEVEHIIYSRIARPPKRAQGSLRAQDLNPLTSDGYRSLAATTLLDWSSYELALGDRRRASELIDQAEMVLGDIELEGIRQSIRPIVDNGRTAVSGGAGEAGSE